MPEKGEGLGAEPAQTADVRFGLLHQGCAIKTKQLWGWFPATQSCGLTRDLGPGHGHEARKTEVCWADRVPGSDSALRTGSSPRAARQAGHPAPGGAKGGGPREISGAGTQGCRVQMRVHHRRTGRAHDLIPPLLGASLRAGAQAGRS